jgi:hypothetical protein
MKGEPGAMFVDKEGRAIAVVALDIADDAISIPEKPPQLGGSGQRLSLAPSRARPALTRGDQGLTGPHLLDKVLLLEGKPYE